MVLVFAFQNCSPEDLPIEEKSLKASTVSENLTVSVTNVAGVVPGFGDVTIQGNCGFEGHSSASISLTFYLACSDGSYSCTKDIFAQSLDIVCAGGSFASGLRLNPGKVIPSETNFIIEAKIIPFESNVPINGQAVLSYYKVQSTKEIAVAALTTEPVDPDFNFINFVSSVSLREGSKLSLGVELELASGIETGGTWSYQWQKHVEGVFVDTENNDSLTYTKVSEASDAGSYRVKVKYTTPSGLFANRISENISVTIETNSPPRIRIESAVDGVIKGWAYDPDSPSQSIRYKMYMSSGTPYYYFPEDVVLIESTAQLANASHSDINSDRGLTGKHGIIKTLSSKHLGKWIFIRAIDPDTGVESESFSGAKMLNYGDESTFNSNPEYFRN